LVFSEYSGLLGENSSEDGFLCIEEIALLQLNAKMVMLSACETGLSHSKRGDGMSGLARSFMVAGAQNVGVSLWEVSDRATMEFMLGVYQKVIHEGKTFREAYSEMKEEFRNSLNWNHPYYWAGFTLYE
jgi:CHAT domain-containing protein